MNQVVVRSVAKAMDMVKEMNVAADNEWAGDYKTYAKDAIARFLNDQMKESITAYLARKDIDDRRNGSYVRHLLTELGDVILSVPRTRTFSPVHIIRTYVRRVRDIDRLILSCFVLGLSTRKVGTSLFSILGEKVSAATVSRVAKTLDSAVMAFHRRALTTAYRALIFDGVILARKTGAGSLKRPVLVALGIRHDGKKEVIDFRLASSESATEWESFLINLCERGLTGEHTEIISVDGGKGLISAVRSVYPLIPLQRCWAHKMRNIMDKIRRVDQERVKRGLVKIYTAGNYQKARSYAHRWAHTWKESYPRAVKCLQDDLDELLTCFSFPDPSFREQVRTTNAIERVFREVKRRTRPMVVFCDRTSMDRILYAVFIYENTKEGTCPVFGKTQNT
jgi:transposase-like protein